MSSEKNSASKTIEGKDKDQMVYPAGYEPVIGTGDRNNDVQVQDAVMRNQLLNSILNSKSGSDYVTPVNTDLFAVLGARRSTRKFADRPVEPEKVDKIIAAADTAPTAGNYQGFEIFLVRGPETKRKLVKACNNQPYVHSPLVLVFCKNPSRVKFDFPEHVLKKFAIQDATLAAGYSQLAAHALGLASIWIGMLDERKVMDIIDTNLVPSSVLCIGYPKQTKFPKSRRNLSELVHPVW